MNLYIEQDEAYPTYWLIDESTYDSPFDISGPREPWLPKQKVPEGILSDEEVADYKRVQSLYEAWQERLGEIYKASR